MALMRLAFRLVRRLGPTSACKAAHVTHVSLPTPARRALKGGSLPV